MKNASNEMRIPDRRVCRAGRGVTLIESVVGVACVVVVSAMVIPGLEEMRRPEKETRCISNLGRIAGAAAVYSGSDSREHLIPVHPLVGVLPGAVGEVEWGGKAGRGEPQAGDDPLSSKWGTQLGRGPATRRLNLILFKGGFPDFQDGPGPNNQNWLNDTLLDLDVYRCPSDYGYTGSHLAAWRESNLTSYDHYGNSYSASTLWAAVAGGNCRLASVSPFLQAASNITAPARTLLYEEHAGRFAWRQNYGQDGCQGIGSQTALEAVIRGWHESEFTFNVAFADGHVGRRYINGHIQRQPEVGRYPDWMGNPTEHEFWRCSIVRGVDWQKDILPARPVATGIPCYAAPFVIGIE